MRVRHKSSKTYPVPAECGAFAARAVPAFKEDRAYVTRVPHATI